MRGPPSMKCMAPKVQITALHIYYAEMIKLGITKFMSKTKQSLRDGRTDGPTDRRTVSDRSWSDHPTWRCSRLPLITLDTSPNIYISSGQELTYSVDCWQWLCSTHADIDKRRLATVLCTPLHTISLTFGLYCPAGEPDSRNWTAKVFFNFRHKWHRSDCILPGLLCTNFVHVKFCSFFLRT